MTNIMQACDVIRNDIDIMQYIHDNVTTDITKVGSTHYIRCPKPGASDSRPSLNIDANRNRFTCYHCGDWSGSVLDLIMGIEGIDLEAAIDKLDSLYPDLDLTINSGSPKSTAMKKARKSLSSLTESLHKNLLSSNFINPFRLDRGFTLDAVNHFELGLTKESYPRIYIPQKAGNGDTIGAVTRGLKEDDTRPKYLTPSSVIDTSGNISKEKRGAPGTYTMFEKSKYLFGLYGSDKSYPVYVVEGHLDVISAYDIGQRFNVGAIGTSLISDDQAVILSRYPSVTLIPDMDDPGRESIIKNYKTLRMSGYSKPIFVSINGYGVKDLNDILREVRSGKYEMEDVYINMFNKNLMSVEEHLLRKLDKTVSIDVLYTQIYEVLKYAVEPITRAKAIELASQIVSVDASILAAGMNQEIL